jgi:hypothetical protein
MMRVASREVRYLAVGSNVERTPQKAMNDAMRRTGIEYRTRRVT